MTFKNSQFKKLQKGFTLVELLVVIAILGVLVIGLIAAINPVEKIKQANDAKAISGLGVIARAAESYATARSGYYPSALSDLTGANELKALPTGSYTLTASPGSCTPGGGASPCTSITVTIPLTAAQYSTTPFARYESLTGKQCTVLTAATSCP